MFAHFAAQIAVNASSASTLRLRAHRLPVTAAVMSEDGNIMYSAGKEGSIVRWDLKTGRRAATIVKLHPPQNLKGKGKEIAVEGHTDEVWALALSSDAKYLVSGGKDKKVVVWDAVEGRWIKAFGGHKDAISVRG